MKTSRILLCSLSLYFLSSCTTLTPENDSEHKRQPSTSNYTDPTTFSQQIICTEVKVDLASKNLPGFPGYFIKVSLNWSSGVQTYQIIALTETVNSLLKDMSGSKVCMQGSAADFPYLNRFFVFKAWPSK